RECDGQLELEVSDTGGDGPPPGPGTGVGLANVRERLRLSFGEESEMRVTPAREGFSVVLTMPLRTAAEPVLTIAA
ncbi:MAG TPA: hypothetical protein VE567_01735, partial [Sphingomonas sp.]|nr:hypothetical protein [Sphingomonas sp.]